MSAMSTNYYTRGAGHNDDPEFHYGKRSGNRFYWAMYPAHGLILSGVLGVVDEYGEPMDAATFDEMTSALVPDLSMLHRTFS